MYVVTGFVNLEDHSRDIVELNYEFLRLCREVARQDKVVAAMKFGVSALFVDRITRATKDDLKELAKSSALLFAPRSSVALDVLMGAILSPEVTSAQIDSLRAAAMLPDACEKEGVSA